MKKIFLVLCLFLVTSCIIHYDKLSFYNKDYKPNCESVRYDGYYLGRVTDANNDSSFQAIFFYTDGSCHITSVFYDSLEIEVALVKYPKIFEQTWGFYQCKDDTLNIETIWREIPDFRAYGDKYLALVKDKKINFIDEDFTFQFQFIQHPLKPDSTLNWLKTHRKYRIR